MLSSSETGKIYNRRKIDVETVFGFMKVSLGFTRFTIRGLDKVRKQTGLLIIAINLRKLSKVAMT
ncbi:MAG: transposase [Aerococcus sp.]|nr:transposase [Aerococcus sp.]